MKKIFLVAGCWLLVTCSFGQEITQKLQKAFEQFEADPQLKHAISSLYVIDANTGKVVFDKNSQIGLAPASTQKIITAATAFELLGKDYGYKTLFYLNGEVKKDVLKGDLIIKGSGDPTLGSWRYSATKRDIIVSAIAGMLQQKQIKTITGDIIIDNSGFETSTIPGGWIWDDIGNYYGAGESGLNWNENQYDLILKSGTKIGDPVSIIGTSPELQVYSLVNELKSAKAGSGDNAYVYIAPYSSFGFVRGTIPVNETNFKISGSFPDPSAQFIAELQNKLTENKIELKGKGISSLNLKVNGKKMEYTSQPFNFIISPSLDSIIYWFLKKSINLYGEALVKTFAYEKKGFGSTDSGVAILQDFWKQKGIDEEELNMSDGSGLSPQNRVTTHAQVEILKYAKQQPWFPYYYDAFPLYNDMKMKSGTIKDVKGFCGYHKAKDGQEYIFSFLVNNYSGRASELVNKMYKVLNVLK